MLLQRVKPNVPSIAERDRKALKQFDSIHRRSLAGKAAEFYIGGEE
jgi:hypothetical protein